MSKTDKEKPLPEQVALRCKIDELLAIKEHLTDWEIKFVNSVFLWRGEFRPRQKLNLIRVYNKYFNEF